MDESEIAWAAGFLDGEGHFGIRRDTRGPRIEAAQVATRAPLDRLALVFGSGTVRQKPRAWVYTMSSAVTMRRVLPLMVPYFSVKADEALLLIESAALCVDRGDPISLDERRMIRESKEGVREALLARRRAV